MHKLMEPHIAALAIYPVKSCAGIGLQQARLLDTGLEWDRAWMLVDSEGLFLTQRDCAQMALVQPQITPNALVLSAPDQASLAVSLLAQGPRRRVQVWDDTLLAFDMGDTAAHWFSEFLQIPGCRLVRFDPAVPRHSSAKWTEGVVAPNQFSDGYPVLVTTEAAISGLNTRLAAQGHGPVDRRRFRPNLEIGGLPEHEEDFVQHLQIAPAASLQLVKPCARCPIPDIDPQTGQSSTAVRDALQAYRVDARLQGAITFGMNAIVTQGAGQVLHVGDLLVPNYLF